MKHNPGFAALVEEARRRIRECTVGDVKMKLDRGERFHLWPTRRLSEIGENPS